MEDDQKVEYLKVSDLVLWTENPRDPIDKEVTDQEIADRALADEYGKWKLSDLVSEMGERYDFSLLPTVVKIQDKYVVLDGNRRIILAKIKNKILSLKEGSDIEINELPDIPAVIPCNVCKWEIALDSVYRKHVSSGTWQPLERDIFVYKHMKKAKSAFLVLEESTGLISKNPHLNKRFVKKEVFSDDNLRKMGFHIVNEKLQSKHSPEETKNIFLNVSKKVKEKTISTRHKRGQIFDVLDPSLREIIDTNKSSSWKDVSKKTHFPEDIDDKPSTPSPKKRTRRKKKTQSEIFGQLLYLKSSTTNDLYRDIVDLWNFYKENKTNLSESFSALIRMALRLLCETASREACPNPKKIIIDDYINKFFDDAKKTLDKNTKTLLSTHNITKESLPQLLHTGAHNYKSSCNLDQTLAISLILAEMLCISHKS